ncbi:MAG: hypothetical protein JWO12_1255, partial [Frankiales bacterium]|nr:hypothetical protein [Frankiales bacterium]
QIEQGRCSDTAKQFDPLVKRRLDAAGLCSAFTTYTELLGSVTKAEAPYSQRRGMLTVVRVPLTLSHGHGEYRVTYHPDGSVAGIYFLKPGAPVG